MASIIRLQNSILSRCILANASKNHRFISTSPKNRETATIAPSAAKEETKVETKEKNWVSYAQMRDWAQREGYLTLRQREAAGSEPISRDLIDPSLIILPSDEELGGKIKNKSFGLCNAIYEHRLCKYI